MEFDQLSADAVDCGFWIHRDLGPGLLESAYELLLFRAVERRGYSVRRQVPISLSHDGIVIEDAFRADMVVDGRLLIEIKSVERIAAVHVKQTLTYLRIMKLRVGLLMNFGQATFKEGVQRVVNSRVTSAQTDEM